VSGAATFSSSVTAERLTINSTTFVPLLINTSYGQVGLEFQLNGTSFGGIGSATNFTSAYTGSNTDLALGTGGSATSNIIFATGSGYTRRMVVTSGGNVLIGTTTNAGFRLDVNGTARVSGQITGRTLSNSTGASDYSIELNGISTTDATTRILINCGTLSSTGVGFGARIINATVSDYAVGTFINNTGDSSIGHVVNTGGNSLQVSGFAVRTNGQSTGGSIGYVWMSGNTKLFYHSVFADESLKLWNRNGDIYYVRDRDTTNITFGSSTHYASAQVAIDSSTKGFLPPRMTNAQRLAISSPAVGLIVYCTDAVEGLYVYKSMGWTFVI
jgi:hypothetical protein